MKQTEAAGAKLMRNQMGIVLNVLDPSFLRSHAIVIDRSDLSIHAAIDHLSFHVGYADPDVLAGMKPCKDIELQAARGDGAVLKIKTALVLQ